MKPGTLKSILSKWLFATMLMLSFFLFSGFVSPSTNKITTPDTTLVVKIDYKAVKSICYKALSKIARAEQLNPPPVDNYISFAHTQKAQLIVKQAENQFANNKADLLYRLVSYPQNPGDDHYLI